MSSLRAIMKRIGLPLKVYGDFQRCPMAANIAVRGRIWPNFELNGDFIAALVICKNEEDPIKMKVLEESQHYTSILRRSREANAIASGGN